jgi:hypothetical protein
MQIEKTAYPVLQASLSILTESAVTTKASAHARCPRCGLGSAQIKLDHHKLNNLLRTYKLKNVGTIFLTFPIPNIDLRMLSKLFKNNIRDLPVENKNNCEVHYLIVTTNK